MKKVLVCVLMMGVVFGLVVPAPIAWGWMPNTHKNMGKFSLVHTNTATFTRAGSMLSSLYGWNYDTVGWCGIESWMPDFSDQFYEDGVGQGQWGTVSLRGYWTNPNWSNLSNYNRLKCLIHIASDVATPGHAPTHPNNNPPYPVNETEQLAIEARADGLSTWPGSRSLTGIFYSFLGPHCWMHQWIDWNAYLIRQGIDYTSAANNGLSTGLTTTPILVQDYSLLHQQVMCETGLIKTIYRGGSVTFNTQCSVDPDMSILTMGPGQEDVAPIIQAGSGVAWIWLDLNNDGVNEFTSYPSNPFGSLTLTWSQVLNAVGLPPNWSGGVRTYTILMTVGDDDGPCGWNPGLLTAWDTDAVTLTVNGM
jgi:hypothetical protein